jgi:TolB-like protein
MAELPGDLQADLEPRYIIERELGRGGMATVYLARDAKHERQVAVKVLDAGAGGPGGGERFRREISVSARLQHPHILTVHDSGITRAGQLWFAMPYVQGETLRDRLRREHQLPVDEAIRLAREIAGALQYAHDHGVIHRDIKPENILLSAGHAIVADFGVARALDADGATNGSRHESLTKTGVIIGTPSYMSPEQARGEPVLGSATDVYSLGAVAYEMLAGEPPFTGPTAQATIAKMMTSQPPSVRLVRPTVPVGVDEAIRRALALVPADRFPSATAFAVALERARVSLGGELGRPGGVALGRRRLNTAPALIVAAVLVGAVGLFLWRGRQRPVAPPTGVRVAVLPFENLGDSGDAYFADGVTDAVRDKLAELPGLEIIARASSEQYRRTRKPPVVIGRELGVKYLLTARVRWDRVAGANRVQVRPELVDAATAAEKWGHPFDAPLTDVFAVQSDIATRVADALGVALSPALRTEIANRPTKNLDAYTAYLGAQAIQERTDVDRPSLERAIALYERAVRLDSGFALAWAALSKAWAVGFYTGMPVAAESASLGAARRAQVLAPNAPGTHAALGAYAHYVLRDNERALTEYEAGLHAEPKNPELLTLAGLAERDRGDWSTALTHLTMAADLDPRSSQAAWAMSSTLLWLRRLPDARGAADRALALGPGNLAAVDYRTMCSLAAGDLEGAKAVLRVARPDAGATSLGVYVSAFYDLSWVLDSADQELVLAAPPSAYPGGRGQWALTHSEIYWRRGDRARARAFADTGRSVIERFIQAGGGTSEVRAFYGQALAYLGRKPEAIQQESLAVQGSSQHAWDGPYLQHQAVRAYIILGEQARALDLLTPLLARPYYLTPAWLSIDPNFAPLRGNPRFQALVAQQ